MTCLKAEYNDLDIVIYQFAKSCKLLMGILQKLPNVSEHPNLYERFRKLTTSGKSMSLLKNSVRRIVPEDLQYKLYVMWRGQSHACKDKTIWSAQSTCWASWNINSLECFGFSHQKKNWSGLKGQAKEWQMFM